MSLSSREKSNLTRWNGRQSPFYEVYYLKWNDPAQSVAAWLRYTLLAPVNRPAEASVWAMFFDAKDPSKNAAVKKTYSLKETRIEREFFYFGPGSSAIFDDGCRGDLGEGPQRATWELKFQEKGEPLWYYPKLLYGTAFPKTKFVEPYLTTKISGDFSFGDRRFTLTNAPAHQGHLWGIEHAESWVWANANTFDDPSFCFDGLSARVKFGEKPSPLFTSLFFLWEGRLYRCNSPRHWISNRSAYELDRWHFEAEEDGTLFVGDYHTSPDRMTAVHYQDPTAGDRYAHHTDTASVEIRILKKSKSGWQAVKTLKARDSAAFEYVQRAHDPRVRLLLP